MVNRIELNIFKKKKTLLLVDFLSVFYRGMHVYDQLEFDGVKTGGLFGMVKQLSKTISNVMPDNIIICSDLKPYLRTLEFPDYKANRHIDKDPERYKLILKEQMLCKEFIKVLKIPFVEKKGFEADDLLAMLIDSLCNDYDKIIVASNDSDLYQLLTYKNVVLYRGEEKGFYGSSDFKKDYPELISPKQWNNVLAYSGGHNGLEGVKGVGIKTAIKYITKQPIRNALAKDIRINKKKIEINIKLGKLPFYKIKNKKVIIPTVDKYNSRNVIRFLSKYGIDVTATMDEMFNLIHR